MQRWHMLVWEEVRQKIRNKYLNQDGTWTCYTCGKIITEKSDAHTSHGKPKGALSIKYKYDHRNLKICCYNCNVNLGGCSDIFISKLEKEKEGLDFLKESCYQDEHGAWRIRHNNGNLQAKDYLPELLEKLKSLEL